MPILAFIVLVLIDFGRIAYVQISLNSAVHEGVRASSFGLDPTTVVINAAPGVAQMSQLSALPGVATTINSPCSTSITGEDASITASITFDWITPIELIRYLQPSSTFGQNTIIRATGVMLCVI